MAMSISGDAEVDRRQYFRYSLLREVSYFCMSPQTSDAHPLSSSRLNRPFTISTPVQIIRIPSRIMLMLFISSTFSMCLRISNCMSSSLSSSVQFFENWIPCSLRRSMSISTFCFCKTHPSSRGKTSLVARFFMKSPNGCWRPETH